MSNWVLRALWISDNTQIRPLELKETENKNISWEFSESYESTQKMLENTFQDDKYLYVCNVNEHNKIKSSFNIIEELFIKDKIDLFFNEIINSSKETKQSYSILQDFGHSKILEFDKYLENFQSFICTYDDFIILAKDESSSKTYLNRRIRALIESINLTIYKIEKELSYWKEKLNVNEVDMNNIIYVKSENVYKFTPTIPVNQNGLNVNFNINIIISSRKTFFIESTTNLFDDAELLVSILKDTGGLLAQDKVKIKDGYFKTAEFSNKGIGYDAGIYDKLPLELFIGRCKVASCIGVVDGEFIDSLVMNDCKILLAKGSFGFSEDCTEAIINKGITTIGTESASIGDGNIHRAILGNNIAVLENLDLSQVSDGEYFLFAPPIKIEGSDGAFVRAVLIEGMK